MLDPAKLTPVLLLFLISTPVQGQDEGLEDEFAFLEESMSSEEVESASKHRQSIFWSPSAITVFTREDILDSGAVTIHDLLRRVPGFDVYETKPSYPVIGARALTDESNNLVLVLVDGRETMPELTGFALLVMLAIDVEEIERIEVIRGPGSTLYGANAYAGVVNIVTVSDSPKTGADLFLSGGEMGHRRLFARVRGSTRLLDGTLSYTAGIGSESRSTPSNSELDQTYNLLLRSHGVLRYRRGNQLSMSLHGGVVTGKGVIVAPFGDFQVNDLLFHWVMGQTRVSLGQASGLKVQLYHSRYAGNLAYRAPLWNYGIWIANVPAFTVDTNTIDAQAQLDLQLLDGLLLTSGGNLRYSILESDNLIVADNDELRGAGFLHLQWNPWEILQLSGGVRLDFNTETEGAISPSLVAIYRPWADHAFRLGYGLAFRKPALIEYRMHLVITEYNPAAKEIVDLVVSGIGNEDLGNEQVHSLEAGWRGHFLEGRVQANLELFYNRYINPIVFMLDFPTRMGVPDVPNSTVQFVNLDAVYNAIGAEGELVWKPAASWRAWCNLGLRRVTGGDTGSIVRNSEPKLKLNFGARMNPQIGWLADLALHYVSPHQMTMVNPESLVGDLVRVPLGNTWLLIGRIGYRGKLNNRNRLEIGLSIRTPLGPPIRETAGVPHPLIYHTDVPSDFGGEELVRLVSLYLRGSF